MIRVRKLIQPTLAIIVSALFILPLYIALTNAFKSTADVIKNPLSLPIPPAFNSLIYALTSGQTPFVNALTLSVIITVVSVGIALFFSGMLGYVLARSTSMSGRLVLGLLLVGLMIPGAVLLGPIVDILRTVGLFHTLPGLIAVNVGGFMPFAVFLFYGFIRALPRDTEEAAAIDGASRMRIFWQVVFPQLKPVVASVAIFLSITAWNDFMNPLIILGPLTGDTVTVGVYRSIGAYSTNYGQLFATTFIASIPVVIAYLLMQRQFVKGLTAGSVK